MSLGARRTTAPHPNALRRTNARRAQAKDRAKSGPHRIRGAATRASVVTPRHPQRMAIVSVERTRIARIRRRTRTTRIRRTRTARIPRTRTARIPRTRTRPQDLRVPREAEAPVTGEAAHLDNGKDAQRTQ